MSTLACASNQESRSPFSSALLHACQPPASGAPAAGRRESAAAGRRCQGAYLVAQQVLSDGGTEEQAALVERYWPQRFKATDYDQYREAMEVLMGIPQLRSRNNLEITEEKRWKPVSRDLDAFIDPMDIIEHTPIPVLAIFGEWDRIIDPVQAAEAYEVALQAAGNQDYQIEVLPRAPHSFEFWPKYQEILAS